MQVILERQKTSFLSESCISEFLDHKGSKTLVHFVLSSYETLILIGQSTEDNQSNTIYFGKKS